MRRARAVDGGTTGATNQEPELKSTKKCTRERRNRGGCCRRVNRCCRTPDAAYGDVADQTGRKIRRRSKAHSEGLRYRAALPEVRSRGGIDDGAREDRADEQSDEPAHDEIDDESSRELEERGI